jgi:hypothetical protein
MIPKPLKTVEETEGTWTGPVFVLQALARRQRQKQKTGRNCLGPVIDSMRLSYKPPSAKRYSLYMHPGILPGIIER